MRQEHCRKKIMVELAIEWQLRREYYRGGRKPLSEEAVGKEKHDPEHRTWKERGKSMKELHYCLDTTG
jgi:hypothetical protein